MNKAVFFDRDGTLIKHIPYSNNPELVELMPNSANLIENLNKFNYKVIVVSNQSAVARQISTLKDVQLTNTKMIELFAKKNARIDGIYFCPHHPGPLTFKNEFVKVCDCRKPLPKLFHLASIEHSIELSKSFMIGDSEQDIIAGKSAGCTTIYLSKPNVDKQILSDYNITDLNQALNIIQENKIGK